MNWIQIAKITEDILLRLKPWNRQHAERSEGPLTKRGTDTSEPPRGWGINKRGGSE